MSTAEAENVPKPCRIRDTVTVEHPREIRRRELRGSLSPLAERFLRSYAPAKSPATRIAIFVANGLTGIVFASCTATGKIVPFVAVFPTSRLLQFADAPPAKKRHRQ